MLDKSNKLFIEIFKKILLCLCVFVLFAGCSQYSEMESIQVDTSGLAEFSQGNAKVYYPSGWTVQNNTLVAASNSAVITIESQDNISSYIDKSLRQAEEDYIEQGYTNIDVKRIQLNGMKGGLIRGELLREEPVASSGAVSQSQRAITSVQGIVVKDGKGYIVSAMILKEQYHTYRQEVENIIFSLTVE